MLGLGVTACIEASFCHPLTNLDWLLVWIVCLLAVKRLEELLVMLE